MTRPVGEAINIAVISTKSSTVKTPMIRPIGPFKHPSVNLGKRVLLPCKETTLTTQLRMVFLKT